MLLLSQELETGGDSVLTGKDLKVKRVILDIKATQVAEVLGVHKSYISHMEKGIREIPEHRRKQWEDFLHSKEIEVKLHNLKEK